MQHLLKANIGLDTKDIEAHKKYGFSSTIVIIIQLTF